MERFMTTKSCVSWSKFDLVWALNLFGTAVGRVSYFYPL
ncbi:SdaC, partial [Pasteurella multocida subsp. multocida str. Anand1_cattle]